MSVSKGTEFPPLWPEGFHAVSLEVIQVNCVDEFDLSTKRKPLMEAMRVVLDCLTEALVTCEIWLDGSFVTAKINPNDIDFIAVVDSRVYDEGTAELRGALDALVGGNLWEASMCCDTNVVYFDPPEYAGALNVLSYWQRRFGFSIEGLPKGILTIKLASPKPKAVPEKETPTAEKESKTEEPANQGGQPA